MILSQLIFFLMEGWECPCPFNVSVCAMYVQIHTFTKQKRPKQAETLSLNESHGYLKRFFWPSDILEWGVCAVKFLMSDQVGMACV